MLDLSIRILVLPSRISPCTWVSATPGLLLPCNRAYQSPTLFSSKGLHLAIEDGTTYDCALHCPRFRTPTSQSAFSSPSVPHSGPWQILPILPNLKLLTAVK